jgi:hypothetical protein
MQTDLARRGDGRGGRSTLRPDRNGRGMLLGDRPAHR